MLTFCVVLLRSRFVQSLGQFKAIPSSARRTACNQCLIRLGRPMIRSAKRSTRTKEHPFQCAASTVRKRTTCTGGTDLCVLEFGLGQEINEHFNPTGYARALRTEKNTGSLICFTYCYITRWFVVPRAIVLPPFKRDRFKEQKQYPPAGHSAGARQRC